MIFTRIRMGKLLNLEQWGKNPCVIFPCFIPTTFIKKDWWWLRQLIVLGSGVAELSVLTHTHTPSMVESRMEKKLMQAPSSLRLCWRLMQFPFTSFLFLFIHGQKWSWFSSRGTSTICSFLMVCSHPRTCILLFWGSHSELGIVCFSSTVFHAKGHSGGQSCVCFSLPIHGLYICCLCPAVKLVFLSILGLCKFLDDSTVQIGSLTFPRCWLWLLCHPYVLRAVLNSLESHFGHDRANNDSGNVFPVLSYISWLIA